jgi:hypothetical protein
MLELQTHQGALGEVSLNVFFNFLKLSSVNNTMPIWLKLLESLSSYGN